jgi:hypothetical protein
MSSDNLDVRISSLEAVIAGYESKLNDPSNTPEEKSEYRKLIITRGENLTELLREKNQSQAGRYLLSPIMFLYCFLRYSYIFRIHIYILLYFLLV